MEKTRRGSSVTTERKLSSEQVHNKKRLETPERAVDYLYSVSQSNVQLVSNL